jgi:hypothetical protein
LRLVTAIEAGRRWTGDENVGCAADIRRAAAEGKEIVPEPARHADVAFLPTGI